MHLSRCIAIAFAVAVTACAQTPAKISALPADALIQIADNDLCEAVNRSTRSAGVVAEVDRRKLGCDSIANACEELGHSHGSPAFASCVAAVEQTWVAQRDAVEQRRYFEQSKVHADRRILANSGHARNPFKTCTRTSNSMGGVTNSCN